MFRPHHRFPSHKGAIYSFALKNGVLYSGGSDGFVVAHHPMDPSLAQAVAKVNGTILTIAASSTQNRLYLGSLQGEVLVLNLDAKKAEKNLLVSKGGIFFIQEWNNLLLLGGGDGFLTLLDLDNYSIRERVKVSEKSLRSLSKCNEKWHIGTSDNYIYCLNENNFLLESLIKENTNSVFALCKDGNERIWSGSRDAHIRVFDKQNMEAAFPAHYYTVNDLKFNGDLKIMASASRDKTIKLWNAENFGFIQKLDVDLGGHKHSVNTLAWNGNELFSGGDDGVVIQWLMINVGN